jgi:hypothetical protein
MGSVQRSNSLYTLVSATYRATAEKHDALKRPMMVVIQLKNLVVHN